MRKLAVAISTGALVLFGLTFDAGAQENGIRDIPEAGNAICDGSQEFVDMGIEAGPPFSDIATAWQENFCPSGDTPPPSDDEGGDETENPLCGPLNDQLIAGFEENGAPEEMVNGLKDLAAAVGCASGDDTDEDPEDEEETEDSSTTTTQAPTTTTTAAVLGQTQTSGAAQTGTALPATGGGLVGAASAGISFLALSSIIRRFFR